MSSYWNGHYDTNKYGTSLEDDILNAGEGRIVESTDSGNGTLIIDGANNRIDYYHESDSEKGHSHTWYNPNDTPSVGSHD